jgi:hypothetical protein
VRNCFLPRSATHTPEPSSGSRPRRQHTAETAQNLAVIACVVNNERPTFAQQVTAWRRADALNINQFAGNVHQHELTRRTRSRRVRTPSLGEEEWRTTPAFSWSVSAGQRLSRSGSWNIVIAAGHSDVPPKSQRIRTNFSAIRHGRTPRRGTQCGLSDPAGSPGEPSGLRTGPRRVARSQQ